MRKRFWKGLRTIDLVIVLAIICVVLIVVAGRYKNFKCRAIESEAKFCLQEIYAAQLLFHKEHNHYARLKKLMEDGRVVISPKYYIFSDLVEPTKNSFTIVAKGVANTLVAGEEWSINELKDINLIKSVCKK